MNCLERWLEGLSGDTSAALCMVKQFEVYACREAGFKDLDEMVEFQKQAQGDGRYKLVDLAISHAKSRGGTHNTIRDRYLRVRSFFLHNRAELPRVPVNLMPTRDGSIGRWTVEVLRDVIKASKPRDQAIYLTLFQGLMDQKRFQDFNMQGYRLGDHIRSKGVDVPYRVDCLRGRKTNRRSYNSWIGHDALVGWQLYFERGRDYPRKSESAALTFDEEPLSMNAFRWEHIERLRKMKIIEPRSHDVGARYGYGLHELRDLSRSLLEKAKGERFNTNSAEYWMGHVVDPLFYNKIWKLDSEYNLNQYRIAEKYLNILSGSSGTSELTPDQLVQLLVTKPEMAAKIDLVAQRLRQLGIGNINAKPEIKT